VEAAVAATESAAQGEEDGTPETSRIDAGVEASGVDPSAEAQIGTPSADSFSAIEEQAPETAGLEGGGPWVRDEVVAAESATPREPDPFAAAGHEPPQEPVPSEPDRAAVQEAPAEAGQPEGHLDDDVVSALAYGAGIVAYATDTSAEGGEEVGETTGSGSVDDDGAEPEVEAQPGTGPTVPPSASPVSEAEASNGATAPGAARSTTSDDREVNGKGRASESVPLDPRRIDS
jgi:hypothetical protein